MTQEECNACAEWSTYLVSTYQVKKMRRVVITRGHHNVHASPTAPDGVFSRHDVAPRYLLYSASELPMLSCSVGGGVWLGLASLLNLAVQAPATLLNLAVQAPASRDDSSSGLTEDDETVVRPGGSARDRPTISM